MAFFGVALSDRSDGKGPPRGGPICCSPLSEGRQPRTTGGSWWADNNRPLAGRTTLSEYFPYLFSKYQHHFFFKGDRRMVLFLIGNILFDRPNIFFANGAGEVTLLP